MKAIPINNQWGPCQAANVELNEAVRRILRGHLKLIVGLVLLGVVPGVVVYFASGATYVASARVQLGTPDPQDAAQAVAIADTARAIVTSPSLVQKAINQADVNRTVPGVTNAVAVAPLGSSGVVELSVTDTQPGVAADLANQLASSLIQVRTDNSRGASQLPVLKAQIDADTKQIAGIDARSAELTNQLQSLGGVPVSPANEAAVSLQVQIVTNQLNAIAQERSSVVQELSTLQQRRDALLQNSAGNEGPAVIQAATPPTSPDRSKLPIDVALGAVIGLVLGIAIATLVEVFRPTLVGRRALANLLEVPVIGHLEGGSPAIFTNLPSPLTQRLELAARAAGIQVIRLIGIRTADGIPVLAKRLQRSIGVDGVSELTVQSYGAPDQGPELVADGEAKIGLIVVAPEVLKKVEMQPLMDLIRLSQWPVLGVITYGTEGIPEGPRNGRDAAETRNGTVSLAKSPRRA